MSTLKPNKAIPAKKAKSPNQPAQNALTLGTRAGQILAKLKTGKQLFLNPYEVPKGERVSDYRIAMDELVKQGHATFNGHAFVIKDKSQVAPTKSMQ